MKISKKKLDVLRALDHNNTARRTREGWFRWERQGCGLPSLSSTITSPMFANGWLTEDGEKLALTATGRTLLKMNPETTSMDHGGGPFDKYGNEGPNDPGEEDTHDSEAEMGLGYSPGEGT